MLETSNKVFLFLQNTPLFHFCRVFLYVNKLRVCLFITMLKESCYETNCHFCFLNQAIHLDKFTLSFEAENKEKHVQNVWLMENWELKKSVLNDLVG